MELAMYLSPKEVKERYRITSQTLHNWRLLGKIQFKKLPSGSYLYLPIEDIPAEPKAHIIYARVSNAKQSDDLKHQISILQQYMCSNGIVVDDIYSDIASGMNDQRQKFNAMIERVVTGGIDTIYVTYKDRLTRFGFGYIENFCKLHNTKIVVVNATREEDFQTELTADLIAIIHHFSMKMYSNRRSELKKLKKQLKSDGF